ncbi:CD276 antigen-like isoform 1-T1 [Anableps anableps]
MHRGHYGLKIIVILEITMCLCCTVSSSGTEVSCLFMESCILPCSLQNGDELILHWFYKEGDLNVHSFYENQDQLGFQNQRFRDRTSLFKDQFPKNNFSLQLTGVKIQDEGRYQCYKSSINGNKDSLIDIRVDAPVSAVSISQEGDRISCSSEGIYPQPELSWSTIPPSNITLENRTRVQQTEDQLYSISSSLVVSDGDPDLIYSCTVRTRSNRKRATARRLSATSATYRTTTIPCPPSNTSTRSLIWRFNQSQIILEQTETSVRVSEAWRKHVKDVSEAGSLTLQDMTSQQEGVYTCELSHGDETMITSISVRIGPENPAPVGIIVGVVAGILIIAAIILLAKYWRNARGAETERDVELQSPGKSHEAAAE